jgi:K+-transporting ATPase ATPase C chain
MLRELRTCFTLFVLLTLLTGLAYPLATLEIGQGLFPAQAEGSLIEVKGKIIGSSLIGQPFVGDWYFHMRPSAAGNGYDASASSGSNAAPSDGDFLKTMAARAAALKTEGGINTTIPVDLVTASASGLDPHLSPAAARFQSLRIAKLRLVDVMKVDALIALYVEPPTFGFLGDNRVNVLALNRALDQMMPLGGGAR